jgi:hypothetical protein
VISFAKGLLADSTTAFFSIDMDLCCLINRSGDQEVHPSASELVEMLSKVIREETDFNVLALPKARIPIIKISRGSTSELPYEISCDIGFENRLALENTRLLLSYAMVDPPRLRTLVLFLKVWTKRRKLNSPYTGTLSSYGYTLLVLFYLTHVKRPAVLPNLQRIPPTRPLAPEEVELNGHNIYFYDDMATLRKDWQSQNTENVAELLIDFFRYFAKEHPYSREVISLKTENGMFGKDAIMWNAEVSGSGGKLESLHAYTDCPPSRHHYSFVSRTRSSTATTFRGLSPRMVSTPYGASSSEPLGYCRTAIRGYLRSLPSCVKRGRTLLHELPIHLHCDIGISLQTHLSIPIIIHTTPTRSNGGATPSDPAALAARLHSKRWLAGLVVREVRWPTPPLRCWRLCLRAEVSALCRTHQV